MSDAAVVRLEGVSHRYGAGWALRDLDLVVGPGESVALLGPSGAGKSTLLRLLNGSLAPSAGRVAVLGEEISALPTRNRRVLQRRIGLIHQDLDLIEQVRVIHNVNAGRLGEWSLSKAVWSLIWPQDRESARRALERVGLEWSLYERTENLSGGERQRVAIARALVQDPDLVLADEPVASLDPSRSSEVLGLLHRTESEHPGHSLIVSLHQPELARKHCTRAIGLREGRIVFDRPAVELTDDHLGTLYEVTPTG